MSEISLIHAKRSGEKKDNLISKKKRNVNHFTNSTADRILFLQRTAGNQAVQRLLRSEVLQAKLRIGQPGDKYEQEADRVADAVMRMPEPGVQRQVEPEDEEEETLQSKPLSNQITPLVQVQRQEETEEEEETLQAKPLAEETTPLVQKQVEPEEEEEELQAKATSSRISEVNSNLESHIQSFKGGGQSLSENDRAFFEPRFGYDFSQVRMHTDTQAAESARAVNARAFTVGRDVVFGAGQYAPGTTMGKRLVAHELTHVVQQTFHDRELHFQQKEAKKKEYEVKRGDKIKDIANKFGVKVKDLKAINASRLKTWSTPKGNIQGFNEGEIIVIPKTKAEKIKRGAKEKTEKTRKKTSKKVCLTFDDGPEKGTKEVLDTLTGIAPAVFFLTGKNMKSNINLQKELVERMLNEGHQIGNHTYTHDPMTTEGYQKTYGDLSNPENLKKFQDNFNKNEKHFQTLLGQKSPVFRLVSCQHQSV